MKSVRICVAAITAVVVCIAVMLGILSAAIYAENESGDSFIGLMYHQVLKDESRAGKYIITPGELESDLAYLSENGYDVSDEIRLPEISMAASKVSAIPAVRAFLLQLQRDMAESRDVIMDGRDIGTVVLPNATVKIYLTADAEVRAKRRYDELIAKGTAVSYESVLTDLKQRDRNDMTREIAPLKQADDAVLADTTELDFEGSCDLLVRIIKEKADIR